MRIGHYSLQPSLKPLVFMYIKSDRKQGAKYLITEKILLTICLNLLHYIILIVLSKQE